MEAACARALALDTTGYGPVCRLLRMPHVQLPIKLWHGLIHDPTLVDAILDRIVTTPRS